MLNIIIKINPKKELYFFSNDAIKKDMIVSFNKFANTTNVKIMLIILKRKDMWDKHPFKTFLLRSYIIAPQSSKDFLSIIVRIINKPHSINMRNKINIIA